MDEEDGRRIHSVSPYGCSHFDAHQTKEEADLRSSAGHYQVDNDADWTEPRIHAIQGVSIFSVLHFSVEIITRWSGNCVIK